MADWLGMLLDPYQTAPSFVCFPSSYAPAPAPLPSTHHWQRVSWFGAICPLWQAPVLFLNDEKLLIL
jgi:hypothetical protein